MSRRRVVASRLRAKQQRHSSSKEAAALLADTVSN